MHLLRIASSSPVCSATWLAWLPTATPLPGRLHACRIHLHLSTVTALPASDSVLRAFFLRLCSTARLPVLTLPYILHQALTDSSRPQDSNSQTRGCSMARGKPASPNLTCVSLQLIRRQQTPYRVVSRKKCLCFCPIWGASRGDGARAVRCWLLQVGRQASRHDTYVCTTGQLLQTAGLRGFASVFSESLLLGSARALSYMVVVSVLRTGSRGMLVGQKPRKCAYPFLFGFFAGKATWRGMATCRCRCGREAVAAHGKLTCL